VEVKTIGRGNFISFILLHLKAVIYARGQVRRNAPRRNGRGGTEGADAGATATERACRQRAGERGNERRHYNRYVSMQTLSFIRLPVSEVVVAILPGPCPLLAESGAPLSRGHREMDCYGGARRSPLREVVRSDDRTASKIPGHQIGSLAPLKVATPPR